MGEQGIRKLINDHYNLIRKSTINHLFAQDDDEFEKAKLRSSDFFIQIMGGHPYFNENRGKPMLGQRHAPFKISPAARIVWLECFREVISYLQIEENLILSFWNYLNSLSMRFVNSDNDNQ
jgi:hemoglobin